MEPPRVLIWDIEVSPILGYTWGTYQQDVIALKEDWYLLSVAWQWLGEKTVRVKALPDFPLYETEPHNDIELARLIHGLFSEADVVVGHNGIAFDTKKAKARMIYHGLEPPPPAKEVDTLRLARRAGKFTSNKLGDLSAQLGIGSKQETGGFKTWQGCMDGDAAAWRRMKRYNKQDVVILTQLYQKLLPWSTNHPNMATISNRPSACPLCGADEPMRARGHRTTQVGRRRRWQCMVCKGWSVSRTSEQTGVEHVPHPN